MSSNINLPLEITGAVVQVANAAALPPTATEPIGSERVTLDTGTLYVNTPTGWVAQSGGGGGGITSINSDTTAAQIIAAGSGISVSSAAGTTTISATGGGSGTVTSVSVTTANGVSGTVATATTTPAISLTLGAITPTSVAASGTVTGSNLSGTNTGNQTITLTSDVTGSGTGSFATTIANNAVTNAKTAQMATLTIKGNNTGGTANAADLTVAQVNAILPVVTSTLNGLAPLSGGGTTNFLRADGTWAAPSGGSGTVTSVSVVTANGFSGTVATATTTPAITLTLGANAVANSQLAQAPTLTLKGNNTGGTANVADLTVAQVNAVLPVFTSTLNGLTPLSGGGTTNFLRADGTWAAAGGGSSPLTTKGDIYGFDTANARVPVGANGTVLTADSTQTLGVKWAAVGGTGTVTSVAMTVPTFLSVSGSPITTTGTLAVTLSGTALPIANGGTNATSFTSNAGVYYNGTSIVSIPNSNMSDASGFVFPDKITFSLPGPRVVQNDCTNWMIMPYAGKIVKVWIIAKAGPTGAAFIGDLQKSTNNGSTFTSIWAVTPANKIQIAAASVAGSQTSFDTTTFAAGDVFRVDIDQVGSTVAGSDLTIVMSTLTQNT